MVISTNWKVIWEVHLCKYTIPIHFASIHPFYLTCAFHIHEYMFIDIYMLFGMDETLKHVSLHWRQGKCQLWANYRGLQNLRHTYWSPTAVASVRTSRSCLIQQERIVTSCTPVKTVNQIWTRIILHWTAHTWQCIYRYIHLWVVTVLSDRTAFLGYLLET